MAEEQKKSVKKVFDLKGIKKAKAINPRTMVIFSYPKVGKTELLSKLDDGLIVDFDDGTAFYDCNSVTIKTLSDLT